jgi:hypothetical protein
MMVGIAGSFSKQDLAISSVFAFMKSADSETGPGSELKVELAQPAE